MMHEAGYESGNPAMPVVAETGPMQTSLTVQVRNRMQESLVGTVFRSANDRDRRSPQASEVLER